MDLNDFDIAMIDLAAVADDHAPTPIDMIVAPLIDRWQLAYYPGTTLVCMTGTVTGHPRLPPGPTTTRPLVAIDIGNRWVRTQGRYYHLGDHVAGRLALPIEVLPQSVIDRIERATVDETDAGGWVEY